MRDTDFTLAKLAILTWRYLYLLKMNMCDSTIANPSYDQKSSHFGDHTDVSHDLQLLSLLQRLRYVHHSQATPISYRVKEPVCEGRLDCSPCRCGNCSANTLCATSLTGHLVMVQSWSKDIKVSLQYAVSRCSVGSHCTPWEVSSPLGTVFTDLGK